MPAPTAAGSSDASLHAPFLRRAVRLAMNGRGRVEPNPLVGCVITRDAAPGATASPTVLGEGYHTHFGGPHAEPAALAAVAAAGHSPAGATVYTTLEPCCHTNKKTPPCVPRLLEAKVARVVIGCLDPNPAVNGQGAAQIRAAGIEVTVATGPLEAACKQLIAPFVARTVHRRPYVTLKWAQTADGKVAGPGGRPIRISNDAATRLVHELRTRSDAILIGAGTALADNPLLTVRVPPVRIPLRVVLDSKLRLGPASNLVTTARQAPLLVIYDPRLADPARADAMRLLGVELVAVEETGPALMQSTLSELHRRGATHVLVEPGPTLASALLPTPLADRLWVFRAPRHLADDMAPSAAVIPDAYRATADTIVGGEPPNKLTEYLNPASPAFFAADPSADFVLATEP